MKRNEPAIVLPSIWFISHWRASWFDNLSLYINIILLRLLFCFFSHLSLFFYQVLFNWAYSPISWHSIKRVDTPSQPPRSNHTLTGKIIFVAKGIYITLYTSKCVCVFVGVSVGREPPSRKVQGPCSRRRWAVRGAKGGILFFADCYPGICRDFYYGCYREIALAKIKVTLIREISQSFKPNLLLIIYIYSISK